jgi:hypothetical protein
LVAFLDVYLDFDFSGDVSSGDGFIDDTYIISLHSGKAAPGQDERRRPAGHPSILRGTDPSARQRRRRSLPSRFVP